MQADIFAEIAARLERAQGPDPLIDALVTLAVCPPTPAPVWADVASIGIAINERGEQVVRFTLNKTDDKGKAYYGDWAVGFAAPVTGSVDAGAGLLEALHPHCVWVVRRTLQGTYTAAVGEQDQAFAPTPALALAAALVGTTLACGMAHAT